MKMEEIRKGHYVWIHFVQSEQAIVPGVEPVAMARVVKQVSLSMFLLEVDTESGKERIWRKPENIYASRAEAAVAWSGKKDKLLEEGGRSLELSEQAYMAEIRTVNDLVNFLFARYANSPSPDPAALGAVRKKALEFGICLRR